MLLTSCKRCSVLGSVFLVGVLGLAGCGTDDKADSDPFGVGTPSTAAAVADVDGTYVSDASTSGLGFPRMLTTEYSGEDVESMLTIDGDEWELVETAPKETYDQCAKQEGGLSDAIDEAYGIKRSAAEEKEIYAECSKNIESYTVGGTVEVSGSVDAASGKLVVEDADLSDFMPVIATNAFADESASQSARQERDLLERGLESRSYGYNLTSSGLRLSADNGSGSLELVKK